MQSAINGVVIVACPDQSSAIIVRGMALKCYSSTVSMQDAAIMHAEFTLRSAVDQRVRYDSGSEEEQRVIEEEIRGQDFIGMSNLSGRDVDSFHLVDQGSSGSLSSKESDAQGRDLSQPEVEDTSLEE
eukprot:5553225-Amphidinium_carterae.1